MVEGSASGGAHSRASTVQNDPARSSAFRRHRSSSKGSRPPCPIRSRSGSGSTNGLSLFGAFVMLASIPFDWSHAPRWMLGEDIVGALAFLLFPLLNRARRLLASRLFCLVVANLIVLGNAVLLGPESGAQMVFIALAAHAVRAVRSQRSRPARVRRRAFDRVLRAWSRSGLLSARFHDPAAAASAAGYYPYSAVVTLAAAGLQPVPDQRRQRPGGAAAAARHRGAPARRARAGRDAPGVDLFGEDGRPGRDEQQHRPRDQQPAGRDPAARAPPATAGGEGQAGRRHGRRDGARHPGDGRPDPAHRRCPALVRPRRARRIRCGPRASGDRDRDAIELCAQRFRQHTIELVVEPIAPELYVECRGVQISQVLLNLLGNAHDAVEGAPGAGSASSPRPTREVRIAVSDSGPGIPARSARAHHGAVLHHQGDRQGHRPRAQRLERDRRGPRRAAGVRRRRRPRRGSC